MRKVRQWGLTSACSGGISILTVFCFTAVLGAVEQACCLSVPRPPPHILALINRLKEETDKHCNRMLKRLRREKDHLFTFLEVDGVEWHNNSAERGIRPCVILRNNSYGSRSEEGASAIAVLMSVKQTCKAKNDNFFDAMRANLFKTCQKST